MIMGKKVVTKRQLGVGMALIGLATICGLLVLDQLGLSQHNGSGATQWLIYILAGTFSVVGLTLIPLGNRPT